MSDQRGQPATPTTEATDFDDARQIHIQTAARWAAHELRVRRIARVILTPGDMTAYPILVAAPGHEWKNGGQRLGHSYEVSLVLRHGHSYPWDRQWVHPSYAAEKWTCPRSHEGTRVHTGEIVAAFLNALAEELALGETI